MKKRLPMYLQHEQAECGHACIAMIAVYFGHDLDLHALRVRFPTSGHGMTLFEMRALCWQLKLNAHAVHVTPQTLSQLSTPCVLHWMSDHFVVLANIHRQFAWIHDPAEGVRKYPLASLAEAMSGVALVIEQACDFEPVSWRQRLRFRDLLYSIQGIQRVLGLILVFSFFLELGQLLPVLLMQYITDAMMGMQTLSNISPILLGCGIVTVFLVYMNYVKERLLLHVSTQFKTQFYAGGIRHLMLLPLSYFQKRLTGQLQLSCQAMDAIQKKLSTEWVELLLEGILLLGQGVIMACYSVWLTLIVLAGALSWVSARCVSYHALKSLRHQSFHQQGKVLSHFIETLQIILSLKASAKELARFGQWRGVFIQGLNADYDVAKLQLSYQSLNQGLQQLEYLAVVGGGVYLMHHHHLSLGMLIAFLSFRQTFTHKLAMFIAHGFDYRLLGVELERAQDIVCQPIVDVSSDVLQARALNGKLEVSGLSFAYRSDQPLLKNINLVVEAGEKVVLVGPSGCGKTTLLKLMMGLLTPITGQIDVDGLSLSTFGARAYLQQIAAVMQEDRLLSGRISENIVFFEDCIDWPWLEEVCRLTAIDAWINALPMRYETHLGELGSILSGGQKQRLLLARALYRRPKILFLDEATSHLDVGLEKEVNAALKQLKMTQIMIAHRPETIAMADRVISLGASI